MTSTARRTFVALLAACMVPAAVAGPEHDHAGTAATPRRGAPMPHVRQNVPPTIEQQLYGVTPDNRARPDLADPKRRSRAQRDASAAAATPECRDMDKLASYSGTALADYLVNLPDYTCTYPLFSVTGNQAKTIFSTANLAAVADRFVQEAAAYNATNMALVNLTLYLRAGYYVADGAAVPAPAASVRDTLRPAIRQLEESPILFQSNPKASTTAGEVIRLVTNMYDEGYHLPTLKNIVVRYTNTAENPKAAEALLKRDAAGGFTSLLTAIYYSHWRQGAEFVKTDPGYARVLYDFVVNNKGTLLGSSVEYQLADASREAFRFLQHGALQPVVRPMIKDTLASSTMLGADQRLWLEAASAVEYFDNANCADYGTCNFRQKLADAVLQESYTCSPSVRIRAQALTWQQMAEACRLMADEEKLFHDFLATGRKPVAKDFNTQLEVVVFDSYKQYDKYASIIYGIATNNGGMYLEGDPSRAGNQARFIAHRADWLPDFKVWNLEHEYVHYLDGRFNMYGDFRESTVKPTVWWTEGLGEYLSLKNDNKRSIEAARSNQYKLSTIFGNTYSMGDYVNRAYRWGYMATRFMFERHRSDIDAILAKFRAGDYEGYDAYMKSIGTRYDAEFLAWVHGDLPTSGDLPQVDIRFQACPETWRLGNHCSLLAQSSATQAYAYVMLPRSATNLKIWTNGGSGDVDLYVAADRYPTTRDYDAASVGEGNRESITIANPVTGRWYYLALHARVPFKDVALSASWDDIVFTGGPVPRQGRR